MENFDNIKKKKIKKIGVIAGGCLLLVGALTASILITKSVSTPAPINEFNVIFSGNECTINGENTVKRNETYECIVTPNNDEKLANVFFC